MSTPTDARLFELADLILAVGRELRPLADDTIDMCSPVESSVMRFIDRHPGASARDAAHATMLPSSNFSRVLRGLERKGLVRREVDAGDARRVALHPTERASQNLGRLQQSWSAALADVVEDSEGLDLVIVTLRDIETHLTSRRGR